MAGRPSAMIGPNGALIAPDRLSFSIAYKLIVRRTDYFHLLWFVRTSIPYHFVTNKVSLIDYYSTAKRNSR